MLKEAAVARAKKGVHLGLGFNEGMVLSGNKWLWGFKEVTRGHVGVSGVFCLRGGTWGLGHTAWTAG